MTEYFRPSRTHIFIALLIVLLAFGLRVVLVFNRATGDARFIPPPLSDSDTYFQQALGILAGTFPDKPYDYQPGAAYGYALLMSLTGQHTVPMLRIALSLVDALGVGLLVGAGWLLTNRAWGGYVTGLFMALYPVSIYYGTVMLLEPLAAFLLCGFCFFALWQRRELSLWRSAILGIITGYLLATRINLVPVAAIWLFYLALTRPGWRRFARHTAAFLLAAAVVITPFTLWNFYAGGRFQVMQSGGWWQLYIGTNRDADGTWGRSVAFDTQDYPGAPEAAFREAILRDILVDPVRFAGLMLRKLAIFWSNAEPGNGDDYFEVKAGSPLLNSLPPILFPHLAFVGLFGLLCLAYQDRKLALFFAGVILVVMFGNLIYFAISRFRYPVVIPLHLLGAYAVVWLWEAARHGLIIRSQSRFPGAARYAPAAPLSAKRGGDGGGMAGGEVRIFLKTALRRYLLPLAGIMALLLFPVWALTGNPPPVPPKRLYAELPADVLPVHVTFDDRVTLRGWRYQPYTRWWAAAENAWLQPEEAYAVELFWSVKQPVTDAYQFFIAYVDDGVRYGGLDRPIGAVSYPPVYTDRWQPGEIYGELVSFRVPAAPLARAGRVMVGVYRRENNSPDGAVIDVPITDPPGLTSLTLQRLAVFDPAALPAWPVSLPGKELVFGSENADNIVLRGYELPEQVSPGETIPLRFYWQALSDVKRDYNLFIHLMDANHQLAAQGDSPVNNRLLTSTWMPGYPVISDIPVTMPAQPGNYSVYIGLIDAHTGHRLAVDAPDFRPIIGETEVRSDSR